MQQQQLARAKEKLVSCVPNGRSKEEKRNERKRNKTFLVSSASTEKQETLSCSPPFSLFYLSVLRAPMFDDEDDVKGEGKGKPKDEH